MSPHQVHLTSESKSGSSSDLDWNKLSQALVIKYRERKQNRLKTIWFQEMKLIHKAKYNKIKSRKNRNNDFIVKKWQALRGYKLNILMHSQIQPSVNRASKMQDNQY